MREHEPPNPEPPQSPELHREDEPDIETLDPDVDDDDDFEDDADDEPAMSRLEMRHALHETIPGLPDRALAVLLMLARELHAAASRKRSAT